MTTTQTSAKIGTCYWGGHKFIAQAATEQAAYCPTCEPVTINNWTQRSGIKWATVKARTTATRCSEVCTSAKCDKCSCECGGKNHGKSLGLAW